MTALTCACHGGRFIPCSYPGGCGSPGGCCDPKRQQCITCAAIRQLCGDDCERQHKHRRGVPNTTDEGLCCAPCRVVLARLPQDIADAYALLPGLEIPSTGKTGDGRSKNPEAPLPLIVDPVDLTAGWRLPQGPIRRARLAANADLQDGHMPVREVLHWRIRDVLSYRDAGEHGPALNVHSMCEWLSARTPWLADFYPAVDEYAAELMQLRGTLLALVGQPEPDERPKPFPVPCPRCHRMTLIRHADMTVECQWQDCARVFSPDDWATVSRATANAIRRGQLQPREDVTA